jgi:hypothetical protein
MTTSRKLKSPHVARRKTLVLAVGLVTLSVGGIWFAIEANNRTEEFLVSAGALPAGISIAESMLLPISANLGSSSDKYLRAGELPLGSYLLGPVVPGQLIIKSMLASAIIDARVPLVITSKMPLPTALKPGSSVDLWVSEKLENNTFAAPYALVLGAEVAKILETTGMFAEDVSPVELWVPTEAIAPVLDAVDAGDSISLILRPTAADG